MKSFFKNLEYRFLVESTKIENALFLYKTTVSEANVRTNRMMSTKWTYHKIRSVASNFFIFLKILFQFKNLWKSWFDIPTTQITAFVLFVSGGVLFDGAFSLWESSTRINAFMFIQLLSYEFHKNCFDLWLTVNSRSVTNVKNYWNTLKNFFIRQTTKQPLSNFEPWKSWRKSNFEGWGVTLVA